MNGDEIVKSIKLTTKKWCKQRKSEERNRNRVYYRQSAFRSYRTTIKEVAWDIMAAAYAKASSDGKYPANARQIMYAARPEILSRATDCETLDSAYFTQTLLPNYMTENPDETANWDVIFDARGNIYEPHTKKEVPLGTLHVRKYLRGIQSHSVDGFPSNIYSEDYPTKGPRNRYSAILFIEKEGFLPLFESVNLARRYDIAIMSTKGMSTTAARHLVDSLCNDEVTLLVLHDFDKAGFSILGTLQRSTDRYTFSHHVNVVDFGLRLSDVKECGLQSEQCRISGSASKLYENGATQEEINFLFGDGGKRVELNAFTSGDFIEWIEGKLKKHRIKKVIPDNEILEKAYRRGVIAAVMNSKIDELMDEVEKFAHKKKLNVKRLSQQVKKRLKSDPELPWDRALFDIVSEEEIEEYGDEEE